MLIDWLIDWLVHLIFLSRESDGALYFGQIRTRLGVDHFPSFPADVLTSSHVNLLLVRSHQAEIIVVKRLIQGRNNQGHKRKCSPKKKGLHKNFSGDLQKFFKRSPQENAFQKIFQALHKILTIQNIVLSWSRGQANFRGLEASRSRPRTWPLRPRLRPRTSKCVLEAKDVLEDFTSVRYILAF